MPFQKGLLATPVPAHARHLFFTLQSPEALPAALDALLPQVDGDQLILGVGAPLAKALGRAVPGLRAFPLLDAAVENPSTQHALWLWVLLNTAFLALKLAQVDWAASRGNVLAPAAGRRRERY